MSLKIEKKINSRNECVDISYLESLLLQLKAHLARAGLRDRHHEILWSKLELLKSEPNDYPVLPSTSIKKESTNTNSIEETFQADTNEDDDSSNILIESFNTYDEGNYSPRYCPAENFKDCTIRNKSDDEEDLEQKRNNYLEKLQTCN